MRLQDWSLVIALTSVLSSLATIGGQIVFAQQLPDCLGRATFYFLLLYILLIASRIISLVTNALIIVAIRKHLPLLYLPYFVINVK